MQKDGRQIVETPVKARGGFLDRPVLIVLIASTVLAIAVLFATGLLSF